MNVVDVVGVVDVVVTCGGVSHLLVRWEGHESEILGLLHTLAHPRLERQTEAQTTANSSGGDALC